jgi:hypothetical protein
VECKEVGPNGPRREDIVLMENCPRSNLLSEGEHEKEKMPITEWIGGACNNDYVFEVKKTECPSVCVVELVLRHIISHSCPIILPIKFEIYIYTYICVCLINIGSDSKGRT